MPGVLACGVTTGLAVASAAAAAAAAVAVAAAAIDLHCDYLQLRLTVSTIRVEHRVTPGKNYELFC